MISTSSFEYFFRNLTRSLAVGTQFSQPVLVNRSKTIFPRKDSRENSSVAFTRFDDSALIAGGILPR